MTIPKFQIKPKNFMKKMMLKHPYPH